MQALHVQTCESQCLCHAMIVRHSWLSTRSLLLPFQHRPVRHVGMNRKAGSCNGRGCVSILTVVLVVHGFDTMLGNSHLTT